MEYYACSYVLNPLKKLNAHVEKGAVQGLLLRNQEGGVACLQPWTSLGDPSMKDQVEAILAGRPLRMGAQALECARCDALARSASISLLDKTEFIPPSHGTLPEGFDGGDIVSLIECGFQVFKVKWDGRDVDAFVAKVRSWVREFPGMRWRFDFNGTLSWEKAKALWAELSHENALIRAIDFWEDPFLRDKNVWQDGVKHGLSLALDRAEEAIYSTADPFDYYQTWVVKPVLVSIGEVLKSPFFRKSWACDQETMPLVFTSNMDHPLGQVWAASQAQRVGQVISQKGISPDGIQRGKGERGMLLSHAGLLTHRLFVENEFSARWERLSPEFPKPNPGETGLGFDDLIEKLPWKKLSSFSFL